MTTYYNIALPNGAQRTAVRDKCYYADLNPHLKALGIDAPLGLRRRGIDISSDLRDHGAMRVSKVEAEAIAAEMDRLAEDIFATKREQNGARKAAETIRSAINWRPEQTDKETDMATGTIDIDIPRGPQRTEVLTVVGRARYNLMPDISGSRCLNINDELGETGRMTVSIEEATLIAQALDVRSEREDLYTKRETNGARRAAERIRAAIS